MPILDVEIVIRPGEVLEGDLAARLADRAGEVFDSPPGNTWVKVYGIEAARYAENGGSGGTEFYPVFVSVLKARLPTVERLREEVLSLTAAVAEVCGRPRENVHVLYFPEAAGRISFGGEIYAG